MSLKDEFVSSIEIDGTRYYGRGETHEQALTGLLVAASTIRGEAIKAVQEIQAKLDALAESKAA